MMLSARTLLVLAAALPPLLHAQTGGNLSNCKGGCPGGAGCVANAFSQPATDDQCGTCARGRCFWPCNFETLCFCSRTGGTDAHRVPPAPKTRLRVNETLDPCRDLLTPDVFEAIVQPGSAEGRALYTYDGLCAAIEHYNSHHDEKFAKMGDEEMMRAELAAFLAHTTVDTRGYDVTRDGMHCVEPITGSDGEVYCKPCKEEHYDAQTKTCGQDFFDAEEATSKVASYKEYCDTVRQGPQGCACGKEAVTAVAVPGSDANGYMPASSAFFARGAIPLSWNYDYIGASQSMALGPAALCDDPDLVSTEPQYAWGAGLYKWMEIMTWGSTGTTAHKQAVRRNFGGTVEALWGTLECPSNKWISAAHVEMVVERVAAVCRAGLALGVYLELDRCDGPAADCLRCEGLWEVYEACRADGTCPACHLWTQHMVSVSPTVTPVRMGSPEDFSDWAGRYGGRSGGAVRGAWSAGRFFVVVASLGGALVV